MSTRNLKLCVFFIASLGLFSCGAEQKQEAESAEIETTEKEIVVETEQEANPLTIYQTSFLGLSPETKIEDYKGTLEKDLLQTGEGDFDIYNLKDDNGNVVAYFLPFGEIEGKEYKVGSITITSQLAETEDGIKIGDTFGTLLEKYPDLKVNGSEIEGYTQATVGNLGYRLDEQHYNYELKTSEIKKDTKITEITIR